MLIWIYAMMTLAGAGLMLGTTTVSASTATILFGFFLLLVVVALVTFASRDPNY